MAEHRFGIFYSIVRILLAILALVAVVFLIVQLVESFTTNRENYHEFSRVPELIWLFVSLAVFGFGFYGALTEGFYATLIYAAAETVLLLIGVAFNEVRWWTRLFPIFAVAIAWVYVWMLHVAERGHEMPRFLR